MIYTSYYAKLRKIPSDIIAYSISNSTPKNVNLPTLDIFVPPWEIVQRYKDTGNWHAFRQAYEEQLRGIDPRKIAAFQGSRDCVLLCWEGDALHCHRSIVAEWLTREYGMPVKEWG